MASRTIPVISDKEEVKNAASRLSAFVTTISYKNIPKKPSSIFNLKANNTNNQTY